MLKKLACFSGWLLVLSLSLIFCFTLGLWLNWSTPTIIVFWLLMLLLVILLWAVIYAVISMFNEKKGRRWLDKYRLSRRDYVLLNQWRHGVSVIKSTRRKGAQLPWYLFMGDRCGKSTLLASAGQSHFDSDSDATIIGPTRTLRWWFFRNICVLDLSSNFLNGATTFRKAWARLTRWCARVPSPSGIIVALSIDDLMNDDLCDLRTRMRNLRILAEPLVCRFGERLPLYIMVTQCDRFPGFSLWSQQLSVAQRQHPLGYSWQTPPQIDSQDEFALHPMFAALKEGMSRVRLSMAHPAKLSDEKHIIVLDFPEAFAALEPKLRYVVAALCESNAYFSPSYLNSIWFSATEPEVENRQRRTGVFIQTLLSGHLRALSLRRGGMRWYQFPRGKTLCAVVLAIITLWIVASASLSISRLIPEVTQLAPDALAGAMAKDERYSATRLRYLPFLPLFNQQQRLIERQLADTPSVPNQASITLDNFSKLVMSASPARQRELILQLAHTVHTWQQMRDGTTLDTLSQKDLVPSELLLRSYTIPLLPLTVMAVERHYMRGPEGETWLRTARERLSALVGYDPTLEWLFAPDTTTPALQATLFWPSLSDSIALPGIWTRMGEDVLEGRMKQIEQAIEHTPPIFRQLREKGVTQRQNAWKQYLIDITASLSSVTPTTLPSRQLVALGQNKSQAMQFINRTLDELQDIPPEQAQPWLITMRQLQRLAKVGQTPTLFNRARQGDSQVRQTFSSWLRGTPNAQVAESTSQTAIMLRKWQNVRDLAVKEAIAQANPGFVLTRGLFTPAQNAVEPNPLTGLLPALTALEESFSPQHNDAGIAAVWLLYHDDARRLLGNAMARSACWLNDQWKGTVLWPLDKDSEKRSYEEQQTLSQLLVSSFLRGPAKMLLTASNNGPIAAGYAGMAVPVSDEFVRFIHQTSSPELIQDLPQRSSTRDSDRRAGLQEKRDTLVHKLSELESKSWKVGVTSMPATVPGGAKVIPTGTQLTLNCQKGDQRLVSMNFAEKKDFSWQPGQCPGMSLRVIFPDFSADYQLNGDDAWLWFIKQLSEGDVLLDSSDFGDSADILQQRGIEQILVRFAVTSPQELEMAWKDWSDSSDNIRTLSAQIASLDENAEFNTFNPISALPDDVAQCQ